MISSNCLNCNSNLEAEDKFCFYCGQQTKIHRLNLSHLGHEVVHFFTHADKGIFFLLKQLLIAPGKVTREYISGKRKKYFSPLNFFLVAVGIYVFSLTSLSPLNRSVADQNTYLESLKKQPQTEKIKKQIMYLERGGRASRFMSRYANIVNMVLTPLVALVFYFFYFKGKFNYTEHLVTNLYAAGLNALVFSLVISPMTLLITKGSKTYYLLLTAFLLWETIYRTVIYYGWMNKRSLGAFLYPLLVSSLVSVGWVALSTGMIGFYIRTGFGF